jgi:hypothetical protein
MLIDFIRGLNRPLDLVAQGVRLRLHPRDQQAVEMKGYVEDTWKTRYDSLPTSRRLLSGKTTIQI